MQFALSKHPAKIDSFNPRAEKHGDENVPAGDIKFTLKGHSSLLDLFDPSYRPFLFRKADSSGDQPSLIEGDNLTALAKPKLKSLRLDEDFPGYVLEIGSGLDIGKPLRLSDVELSGWIFEAIEGGSVGITFSATVHGDADDFGELCQQIQNVVDVTLEPPKAEAQLMHDAEEEADAEA
jgi:hypothetical protein